MKNIRIPTRLDLRLRSISLLLNYGHVAAANIKKINEADFPGFILFSHASVNYPTLYIRIYHNEFRIPIRFVREGFCEIKENILNYELVDNVISN